MTRLLAHAAIAVALYVASEALGRLGDRVAARSARGARWPWARETSTSKEVDTDTRDDDAPTVSAYPRQAPDVDEFGRPVEDGECPQTWEEEWASDECGYEWRCDDFDVGDDAGPPPCWRHAGTDHAHDYCPQIPF